MAAIPEKVLVGDLIRAEDFNTLVEAVRRSLLVSTGAGLAVQQSTGGISVALLASLSKYAIEAIITAAPEGEDVPIAEAVYDAQIVGDSGGKVENVAPRYGRLFAGDVRVKPAMVGDYCWIIRMPVISEDRPVGTTADLCIFSEQVLTRRCATAGGSGGTTPPGSGGETPPPPPPPGSGTPGTPDSTPAPPGGSF